MTIVFGLVVLLTVASQVTQIKAESKNLKFKK